MFLSPVDSSRFGSSGNLSQASSQFSSEPEEQNFSDTQVRPATVTQPLPPSDQTEKGEREIQTTVEKEVKVEKEVEEVDVPKPPLNRGKKPERQQRYVVSFYFTIDQKTGLHSQANPNN